MDIIYLGHLAAIATSILWSFNSIFFASAGKKIGSISVNSIRIIIAVMFLGAAHLILIGSLLPTLSSEQWMWIALSGIVGLGIGDFALFSAFVIIGPRLSMLMMSMSPIFTSITAFLLLGETLSTYAIIGITLTITGVSSVILSKGEHLSWPTASPRESIRGTMYGLIGSMGQGIGIVFAKKAILTNPDIILNPLSAAFSRMIIASIFIWAVILLTGRIPLIKKALKNREGIKLTTAGAFVGPFLGVTFSMVAVTMINAGIAQTLMSLMPIIIIPIVWAIYKEKTSLRGIIGALIAIVGVTILFLI